MGTVRLPSSRPLPTALSGRANEIIELSARFGQSGNRLGEHRRQAAEQAASVAAQRGAETCPASRQKTRKVAMGTDEALGLNFAVYARLDHRH